LRPYPLLRYFLDTNQILQERDIPSSHSHPFHPFSLLLPLPLPLLSLVSFSSLRYKYLSLCDVVPFPLSHGLGLFYKLVSSLWFFIYYKAVRLFYPSIPTYYICICIASRIVDSYTLSYCPLLHLVLVFVHLYYIWVNPLPITCIYYSQWCEPTLYKTLRLDLIASYYTCTGWVVHLLVTGLLLQPFLLNPLLLHLYCITVSSSYHLVDYLTTNITLHIVHLVWYWSYLLHRRVTYSFVCYLIPWSCTLYYILHTYVLLHLTYRPIVDDTGLVYFSTSWISPHYLYDQLSLCTICYVPSTVYTSLTLVYPITLLYDTIVTPYHLVSLSLLHLSALRTFHGVYSFYCMIWLVFEFPYSPFSAVRSFLRPTTSVVLLTTLTISSVPLLHLPHDDIAFPWTWWPITLLHLVYYVSLTSSYTFNPLIPTSIQGIPSSLPLMVLSVASRVHIQSLFYLFYYSFNTSWPITYFHHCVLLLLFWYVVPCTHSRILGSCRYTVDLFLSIVIRDDSLLVYLHYGIGYIYAASVYPGIHFLCVTPLVCTLLLQLLLCYLDSCSEPTTYTALWSLFPLQYSCSLFHQSRTFLYVLRSISWS
jgi:hypothetical protein